MREAVARVAPSVVRIETLGGVERVGRLLVGEGPTTGLVVSADGFIVSSAFNFIQQPTSILVTLPDSNVHYIYATGEPAHKELLNEESLYLVLDALDEAYDHVIVTGRYNDARALFEAIQGRFDAGMTVAEASVGTPPSNDDSFLGFDVADIEIIHYVRCVEHASEHALTAEVEHGNANMGS